MAISGITSQSALYSPNTLATQQAEAKEPTVKGKDIKPDGDRDDNAVGSTRSATPPAQASTVNTSGQVVGSLLNTKA